MMRKKITYLLALTMLLSTSVSAQTYYSVYDSYVANFSEIAIQTTQKYSVPASILLAQGMLESTGGTSTLAVEANNHFGIKCQNWRGATYQYRPNEYVAETECFRKYASVAESFEDQAQILKFNPRYKVLTQYKPDNYTSWAKGLQHTGYATSPEYANRLIKLIRHYKLDKFDKEALKRGVNTASKNTATVNQTIANQTQNKQRAVPSQAAVSTARPAVTAPATAVPANTQPVVVNQNFNVGEARIVRQYDETRVNGVRVVAAQGGDNLYNIARTFRVDPKNLLTYNDLPPNVNIELKKGDLVFLQAKRPVAARGYNFHQVQAGESMHSISQMYAIKLPNLYKLNKMNPGEKLSVGQVLKLR